METRTASSPLVGLLRTGIVASLAAKLAVFTAPYGFDQELVIGLMVGLVTAVGKLLRDRGFKWAQF